MRFLLTCLILLVVPVSGAAGQVDSNGRKQSIAVRVANGTIRVDGDLSDQAWRQARPITELIQKEPVEGAAATEPVDIRFAYDDGALYVGARMGKREGGLIQAPMGRRDNVGQAEYILIALDTFLDRRTAYVFGVTASGVRVDRFHSHDDERVFDTGFDPVWEARTRRDEGGWTAELWIPFSQLRFNTRGEQVWGLNIHRYTPTLNEDAYWMPVPRTERGWSSRFGELRGIGDISGSRGVELLPYVAGTSTLNANRDVANPFDNGRNLRRQLGADIKVGLGPNLTLDATVNPDFGQVEADPAEVNLSAFETFFSEKRPFFTEGSALLSSSSITNYFYSRRIGATPSVRVTGDFVDYPSTSTILGAAKVTGRLASGTSLGMLAALTDDETARTATRATSGFLSTVVAARTAYGLARVVQEFGPAASTIAAMATVVHRDLDEHDALAALLTRDAVTASVDSDMRFAGGLYEVNWWAGMTRLAGEAPAIALVQRSSPHLAHRPDRDYTPYDPTRTSLSGYKVGGSVERTGGRHWLWNGGVDIESPNYEPNDLGRMFAADGLQLRSDVRYRETNPGRTFRSYSIGVNSMTEWTYGHTLQTATLQAYANQTWKNFWGTRISVGHDVHLLDSRLTRGGPIMMTPRGWDMSFHLNNNPSRQLSWSTDLGFGITEDGGQNNSLRAQLSFRPAPRWQLSLDPNFSRQIYTQQFVTTLDGGRPETFGRRYVFGFIDRSTYSMRLRANYTFKPDLTVDVYAEPFAASGAYSQIGELLAARSRQRLLYGTEGTTAVRLADGGLLVTDGNASFRLGNNDFNVRSLRSNVVLRWEWQPGSTFYLVWQQNRRVSEAVQERIGLTDPFRSFSVPGSNYFVVKTTMWLRVP